MPAPELNADRECRALSFQSIFNPVEANLRDVQNRIREVIQTDEPLIRDRLLMLMDRPGKMIRPALVLLAGHSQPGIVEPGPRLRIAGSRPTHRLPPHRNCPW